MQKIIRRTKEAVRKAAKRRDRAEQFRFERYGEERREHEKYAMSALQTMKYISRNQSRDAWNLGPLAQRRNVFAYQRAAPTAANIDGGAVPLTPAERHARCEWAGGSAFLCLRPGDRVVVTQGVYRGKITQIRSISRARAEIELEGVDAFNKISHKLSYDLDHLAMPTPAMLPISFVRLVHPLPDPTTGQLRDTIINRLVPRDVYKDKPTRELLWDRVIPDLNIAIPWPMTRKERQKADDQLAKERDIDTKRLEVEEATYVPRLLTPPFPSEILDELRGYYSAFRTRHEDAYIEKKTKEEEEAKEKLRTQKIAMRTPMQELTKIRRLERKMRGQPKLTRQMLVRLGQVIAKNRPFQVAKVGLKPPLVEQEPEPPTWSPKQVDRGDSGSVESKFWDNSKALDGKVFEAMIQDASDMKPNMTVAAQIETVLRTKDAEQEIKDTEPRKVTGEATGEAQKKQ